jgi:hypothetical protein
MDQEAGGRIFRSAWINGVNAYFPGAPKAGYIAPWEEMSEWEQQSAIAVYGKVCALIQVGLQQEQPVRLAPEQGGRFISEAWNVQVYRHIPNPKPAYIADWDELPEWQRRTDIDIFSTIEEEMLKEATPR